MDNFFLIQYHFIMLVKYQYLSEFIEDAERMAKAIRPIISIREPQREALENLFEK